MTDPMSVLLLTFVASVVAFHQAAAPSAAAPQKESYLLVQKSTTCNVVVRDGEDYVTFTGLGSVTTEFSDRPFRSTNKVSTQLVMDEFSNIFRGDLPNANFLFEKDGVEQGPFTAIINATTLDGKPAFHFSQSPEQVAASNMASFVSGQAYGNCVVFIDNFFDFLDFYPDSGYGI